MGHFSQLAAAAAAASAATPCQCWIYGAVTTAITFTITVQSCLPSPTSLLTQHARWSAVWGVTGASFILGLPLLNGVTAFSATTSIACAGLALTYSLPILLRILFRASYLEGGPFTLGRCAANCPCALLLAPSSVTFALPALHCARPDMHMLLH